MQQVTIIGLGLIGGSIGLGLRRWSAAHGNALSITGFDEDVNRQATARKVGAIDQAEWSLVNAVKNADVVIVCTPVGAMQQVFADIADHLKSGAIVTDTGSTKAEVLEDARALPRTVSFVGGHPMAGKSGSLEAADADLFRGATWVICPSPHANEEAIRNVLGIVAALDAEAFFVDPVEHDAFVAGVSHLPFVVSATLATAVTADPAWRDMRSLAASGFRDTTRLALGNPVMHRDIALSNRASLTRWIDQYIDALSSFRETLTSDTAAEDLLAFFTAAQDARARVELPVNRAAEQALDGQETIKKENMSEQMSRMFLGGLGRKRRGQDPRP